MTMTDPIARANEKLDRVKIRQKGKYLYLRATLPDKQGGEKWKQTDVRTGCPANDKGYKAALAKAQRMESDLIFERFNWDDWQSTPAPRIESAPVLVVVPAKENIETAIARFEKNFWDTHPRTPGREEYYRWSYARPFSVLPLDQRLTADVLKQKLVAATAPDTRIREAWHMAYSALGKFCGITFTYDWRKLRGKYKPGLRYIPTDNEVIDAWIVIQSGPCKWLYGMIATYGLRPHELAGITYDWPRVHVARTTKTQERVVYPLHPDWVELFKLTSPQPIEMRSPINSNNGRLVGQLFRRHYVPYTRQVLRDAYAIRGARLGISPAIMAKWLGHSLKVHYDNYLRHLDQIDFDGVWENLTPGKK
jgi:hypothetical protein